MNILLAGALSWNPERMTALAGRGHRLFGVWSRSMPWEQGPYPFAKGIITDVDVHEAIELLHDRQIDVVYSLFQSYDHTLWAKDRGTELPEIWSLLSTLLEARAKGAFDAPIVRHWGFDIHTMNPGVAREFDGQIFCNRQKFDYWMLPRSAGGCGLDAIAPAQSIAFMDSDLPLASFMNDDLSPKLSSASGEIHTVCIGRPLGIDLAGAARNGIHVHVYGNGLDDIAMCFSHTMRLLDRRSIRHLLPFLHIHPSLQPTGGTLREIQDVKNTWVREFSRYDAGWSYVGRPLPWPVLDDRAAIPNRLGTYMLAGLPVISERLPGFYRYDLPAAAGAVVEFNRRDYSVLAQSLRDHERLDSLTLNARNERHRFSFESTLDELVGFLASTIEKRGQRLSQRTVHRQAGPSGIVGLPVRPFSVRGMFIKPATHGTARMRVANRLDDLWSRFRWFFARTIGRRALARELARPQRGS
jgi:hypothetical protein